MTERFERPLGLHPPLRSPEYRSTVLRAPSRPLVPLPHRMTEVTGPVLGEDRVAPGDADLTRPSGGGTPDGEAQEREAQEREAQDREAQDREAQDREAQGQRIIVHGRVLDSGGRPVPHTLVEVWQANAAGRYRHARDTWPAPLDPNFTGAGRTLTDADGYYRFTTVKPGIYPWGNHHNAWRPAHIHFSLFGRAFVQRLVTQMYFPDDPMFPYDPIFNSIPDPRARQRLVSRFDLEATRPDWALAFAFDIVLRGPEATPTEDPHDD